MGRKHNSKGRSKSGPPFVQLPWFMLDSEAWQALTPQQVAVYLDLARNYDGSNNGTLALSVRDAARRCRINKDTANKALATLEAMGFTECATPGRFNQNDRRATEWRLTLWRCNKTGALPTKAFMKWRPPSGPERNTFPDERNSSSHLGPRRSPETGHQHPEQAERTLDCPKRGDRKGQNQPLTVPNEGTHIHSTMVGVSRIVGVAGRGAEPSNSAASRPASLTTGTVVRLPTLSQKIGPRAFGELAVAHG
jgi:hypothetical protein